MDFRTIFYFIFATLLCKIAEMKQIIGGLTKLPDGIDQRLLYKNIIIPDNWRTDYRYEYQWKGGFTYGLPPDANCPRVIIPSYGRVVCSNGRGLSRVMCLSECMIGYQHVEKSQVFICRKDGTWMNIFRQKIATPFIQCAKINHLP